jgi:hypothetical protein
MKIENMPTKLGQIVGEFVVIHYLQAIPLFKVLMKRHLKPNGFFKNGNELILGNGKIEFSLGASYFAKGIDFESVKYKFNDC